MNHVIDKKQGFHCLVFAILLLTPSVSVAASPTENAQRLPTPWVLAMANDTDTDADANETEADDQSARDETEVSSDPTEDDAEEPESEPRRVGWMELSGALRDGPPPYAWVDPEDLGTSQRRVIRQLHRVAENDDYAGVVIHLENPSLSLSQIYEITNALEKVQAAGRKVLVFSDHYDLRLYLLAACADQVLLQRKGMIELSGIGIEEIYLAGLLDKLGMRADMIQIGKFKGADEQFTRTGPSEAWNENIKSLLDDLYSQILHHIAHSRGVTDSQAEQLLADSWGMSDEQYVDRGLIDALTDRDMTDVTGEAFGDDFEWDDLLEWNGSSAHTDNPFALFRMMFQEKRLKVRRPSIAVIHATGPIHIGESGSRGAFGGESIGSRTLSRAITEAKDNDLIKGAVLRIDSPGGSALASELIWQEIRQLSEEKPVFASVDSSALSGGYYIACAADEIYVTPTTMIGSIGVVGGKITLGQLYDKIGVSVHRRSRGPWGDMFNSVEPFTPKQRKALKAAFNRVYQQFTDRVQIGRGKRVAQIEKVAQGRLFTGNLAVRQGLADKIGGLEAAIADLAAQLGLEEGQYDLIDLPEPQSLSEFLEDMFDASAKDTGLTGFVTRQALIESARVTMGNDRWRAAAPILTGLMMLRHEPVLTLIPTALWID